MGIIYSSKYGSQTNWRLFTGWVLATVAGTVASLAVGALLSIVVENSFFHYSPNGDLQTLVSVSATSAVAGLVIGLAQWRVLRRHIQPASHWILATSFGWGLLGAITLSLEVSNGPPGYDDLLPAVAWDFTKALAGGLALGLVQYVALEPRNRRTAIWPPATGLALGVGIGLASAVIRATLWRTNAPAEHGSLGAVICVAAILGLLLPAIVQGLALVWILRPEQIDMSDYTTPPMTSSVSE